MLTKGRRAKNTAIRMTGNNPWMKFTKPGDNAFNTKRKKIKNLDVILKILI